MKLVECATLGTLFCDILDDDGNLFARELPRSIGEIFVVNPGAFGGNPHADTPMLRTWVIEQMYRYFTNMKKAGD